MVGGGALGAEDVAGVVVAFAVDRSRLEEVLRDDPYYRRTPGVEVRSVREWAPVVGGVQEGWRGTKCSTGWPVR